DDEEADGALCSLAPAKAEPYDARMGIWRAPYLQCIRHLRLEHIATEQIWHHGGGCELLVNLFFTTYSPGLISAAVRFDSMTYHLPIDVRSDHASALFQVEAPKYYDVNHPDPRDLYEVSVELDGQRQAFKLGLSHSQCVTHFPV
ncbi:hypothetical protein K6U46_16805, partial [Vibrio diabolicus]|nr:hypothetical protein [Vibrio diabolicus]